MKTGAIVDPSVSAVGRVFPGPSDAKDLAAFNKETLDALGSRYNLPDIQKDDAHVFRDADGYYQVKEEFTKPTNPFERLKLAKKSANSINCGQGQSFVLAQLSLVRVQWLR